MKAKIIPQLRRRVRRHAWAGRCRRWAALASLALILIPLQAFSHAQVVRINPADDSALAKSPARVEIWFNELLEDGFNSVEIFSAEAPRGGKRINLAENKPALDPKDRTHLTLNLPSLPPGKYSVEWRVLSRDGHSAPGKILFRVLPAQQAADQRTK